MRPAIEAGFLQAAQHLGAQPWLKRCRTGRLGFLHAGVPRGGGGLGRRARSAASRRNPRLFQWSVPRHVSGGRPTVDRYSAGRCLRRPRGHAGEERAVGAGKRARGCRSATGFIAMIYRASLSTACCGIARASGCPQLLWLAMATPRRPTTLSAGWRSSGVVSLAVQDAASGRPRANRRCRSTRLM